MAFPDLQSFLQHLERAGELKRIKVEVDPELEITEITTRVVKDDGPALLFERVRGSAYPLAINTFGSMRRIELALGRHPRAVGEELAAFIDRLNPPSLHALWASRKTARRLLAMRKKRVSRAPCQQISEPPDLSTLPILKSWPGDGGRFLTLPLVLTEDPESGRTNLGIYRMHVYDKDQTGMHWQIQKGGAFHHFEAEKQDKPLEVAVALGGDPALIFSAILPLPEGLEELAFGGFLRGRPTPMVKAQTLSLHVPASAEFILEGVVPPGEREQEGPFGDHYGYYSDAAPFPVFHLRRITHRRNPVYPAAVVGRPPQEDRAMGDAVQEILVPFLKLLHPELRDLWAYFQAGFHNLLVVAVETRYGKEAVKTALGLLGQGQLSLAKCVVLVDPAVNVRDFAAVVRAIGANFDPAQDFILLPGVPADTLEFAAFKMNLGSKMILDATTKDRPPAAPSPERIRDPAEVDARIQRWRLLEGTLLVVQIAGQVQDTIEALMRAEDLGAVKLIAAVSPDVQLDDEVSLLWGIFTRFDPARDVVFQHAELRGACPVYRGRLGIDATFKEGYPAPLEMTAEIRERVSRRWDEYWK